MSEPVIMTNPARCRDCYRCVRNCDVKAIRVKEGQAQVVPELCILCGTCVRICPQKAKDIRSAMQDVNKALGRTQAHRLGGPVRAGLFWLASVLPKWKRPCRNWAFIAAEETAVGAEIVALRTGNMWNKCRIAGRSSLRLARLSSTSSSSIIPT